MHDVPDGASELLQRWRSGDADARARLLELLHDEMRAVARRLMRSERRGHTLQPTAVVHEACVRLLGAATIPSSTRAEFVGLAAYVMRQVLVDHARQHGAEKRAGSRLRISLSDIAGMVGPGDETVAIDVVDFDDAMKRLQAKSVRQARVVELRVFGGLTIPETAEALKVNHSTVEDDWRNARAFLAQRLGHR